MRTGWERWVGWAAAAVLASSGNECCGVAACGGDSFSVSPCVRLRRELVFVDPLTLL